MNGRSTMEGASRYASLALAALRVVTGLLFMQHGMQKLFLWPASAHSNGPVSLLSLFGVAGVLELFGGLLVVVGFLTRPVAFVLAGQMAVAYWMFHFSGGIGKPDGWLPVVNGGDSAIQFCFVFLYLAAIGAGRWSIDGMRAAGTRSAR